VLLQARLLMTSAGHGLRRAGYGVRSAGQRIPSVGHGLRRARYHLTSVQQDLRKPGYVMTSVAQLLTAGPQAMPAGPHELRSAGDGVTRTRQVKRKARGLPPSSLLHIR